jgi:hypothetical protein
MNRPQVDHFLSGVLAYFPSGARTNLSIELVAVSTHVRPGVRKIFRPQASAWRMY